MINGILDKEGKEIYKQKEIEKEIKNFYTNLYKKKEIQQEKQWNYLNKLLDWRFSSQQLENSNKPMTASEIGEAWKKQKNGKAHGPDGLQAEYYKAFEEILIPHFKKLTEDIGTIWEIPDSWKEAHVSLIHKEGMGKKQIKNYRPISLLNVDYKIYMTIWATRLKEVPEEMIQKDQKGFIPKSIIKYKINNKHFGIL